MINENHNINVLIKKLIKEGLKKGKKESDQMVENAIQRSNNIIENAEKEANKILANVGKFEKESKEKLEKELKMSTRDFIINFNEKFKKNIIFPIVDEEIKILLKDVNFLNKIITKIILKYFEKNNDSLEITIPKKTQNELSKYFAIKIESKIIEKKIKINEENILGFKIKKNKENFTFDFTIESITEKILELIEIDLSLKNILKTK